MTPLPQGQDFYDPWSFLSEWQTKYGELTVQQKRRFLKDPRLIEILLFHKYSVEASLDEFKTFDEILNDLHFKANYENSYVEITAESLGMEDPEPWATTLGDLGLE